jgi:hypothetical protein
MNAFLRSLPPLVLAATVVLASPAAHAQASAPAAAPAPAAPIDAAKQKEINRILAAFHPENAVLQAVQQQGVKVYQQAAGVLQSNQVPQDRKDKTLKDIEGDVRNYVTTTMPLAMASAKKFVEPTTAPILAQNFSTEELRQLAAMLESPLRQKFEKLAPQMQDAVGQKVSAEIGPQVNKNVQVMTDSVGGKLRSATTPAASTPGK